MRRSFDQRDFDLAPIRCCYLNEKLQLSEEDVSHLSPQTRPLSRTPLIAVCGSGELPELQRQTWDFARLRRRTRFPEEPSRFPVTITFPFCGNWRTPKGC